MNGTCLECGVEGEIVESTDLICCTCFNSVKAKLANLAIAANKLLLYHYHNDSGVKPKEYHNLVAAMKDAV